MTGRSFRRSAGRGPVAHQVHESAVTQVYNS